MMPIWNIWLDFAKTSNSDARTLFPKGRVTWQSISRGENSYLRSPAAHRRMLPVFHFQPILRPSRLIRPVAALRDKSLQSHVAGGPEEVRPDLALLERRDVGDLQPVP